MSRRLEPVTGRGLAYTTPAYPVVPSANVAEDGADAPRSGRGQYVTGENRFCGRAWPPSSIAGVDAETLELFEESGAVKLSSVFTPTQVERMRDVVWRDLFHSDGVVQEDGDTWRRRTPGTKLARPKRHPVFDGVSCQPATLGRGPAVTAVRTASTSATRAAASQPA